MPIVPSPPQKKPPGGRHSTKKGMIGSNVSGIADEEETSSGQGEDIVLPVSGARGGGRIRGWKKELINRAWGNQVKSSQELTKQMVLNIHRNIQVMMANRRQGN